MTKQHCDWYVKKHPFFINFLHLQFITAGCGEQSILLECHTATQFRVVRVQVIHTTRVGLKVRVVEIAVRSIGLKKVGSQYNANAFFFAAKKTSQTGFAFVLKIGRVKRAK